MNEFKAKMIDDIKTLYEKNLFKVDENAFDEESILFFTDEIKRLVSNIIMAQSKGLDKITNLYLMLPRLNIENEILEYKALCYGEKMYIEKLDFEESFNVEYIFNDFVVVKKEIPKTVRKFVRFDVEEGLKESSKYIEFYHFIIVKVLREVFKKVDVLNLIDKIDKSVEFNVFSGEIYEKPYLIYQSSSKER